MRRNPILGAVLGCGLLLAGCYPDPPIEQPQQPGESGVAWPTHFPPVTLADDQQITPARIALGKMLFFDRRLSRDNTISCASCHKPSLAFSDGLQVSQGIDGRTVTRNAPALVNLAWATSMFWDGGSPSLELQSINPIENPNEMGSNLTEVIGKLSADPGYVTKFQEAYGRAPDSYSITRALAAYERSLISAQSPYDRYVTNVDPGAISASARRGSILFFGEKAECFHCHAGNLLSDFTFQNNGLYKNYPDAGRFQITGREADRALFKVPSLRNVGVTAPYMHDGSFQTLEQVIRQYESGGAGHVNQSPLVRPFTLTDQERADMLAFLESLTDPAFLNNPDHRP